MSEQSGNLRMIISDGNSKPFRDILFFALSLELLTGGRCANSRQIIRVSLRKMFFLEPQITARVPRISQPSSEDADASSDDTIVPKPFRYLGVRLRTIANIDASDFVVIYNPKNSWKLRLAENYAANKLYKISPFTKNIECYRPHVYIGKKPYRNVFIIRVLSKKSERKLTHLLLKKQSKTLFILGDDSEEQNQLPIFMQPIIMRVQKLD